VIMSKLKPIILSAGKGERLWPLTVTRPKPLLPILCEPLIDIHINAIRKSIKQEPTIVAHHRIDVLKKHLRENNKLDTSLIVDQGEALGTGHAVKKALEKIESKKVVIIYGDVLVREPIYTRLLEKIAGSTENLIVGSMVRDTSRYGVIITNPDSIMENLMEKPGDEYRNMPVNAGIMSLDTELLKEALEKIKPSPRGELELTDALKLISKKTDIKVIILNEGEWIDVGTPWDYLDANRMMLEAKCENEGRSLQECIIGREYIVNEPVVIEGPVFVGKKAVVGPFSHIRGYTIICDRAKIGFASQVKASIVLEEAKIPHLNYVGDSIVGEHSNLGAGTITANLRHDRKSVTTVLKGKLTITGKIKFGSVIGPYAKTGINTSLSPGVKIGAYSWIDSGCIVKKDVPDYTLLKCRQSVEHLLIKNKGKDSVG
jgi:UDP-N-acetylglucosamine diphosphorylase/glucosamine-1-phosphate N-acetyltransferase